MEKFVQQLLEIPEIRILYDYTGKHAISRLYVFGGKVRDFLAPKQDSKDLTRIQQAVEERRDIDLFTDDDVLFNEVRSLLPKAVVSYTHAYEHELMGNVVCCKIQTETGLRIDLCFGQFLSSIYCDVDINNLYVDMKTADCQTICTCNLERTMKNIENHTFRLLHSVPKQVTAPTSPNQVKFNSPSYQLFRLSKLWLFGWRPEAGTELEFSDFIRYCQSTYIALPQAHLRHVIEATKESITSFITKNQINYHCSKCNRGACKLWRHSYCVPDDLRCASCMPPDKNGHVPTEDEISQQLSHTDQFSYMLPAVPYAVLDNCDRDPNDNNTSFWGYGSIPDRMMKWWNNLSL